ncbi:adenylate/guanylate cyclase domain-containing protein [Ottowia testudinis]|uniref:AAA family ATPase n=1 Tax=Ottowia testudinis TaxID=2816950 RepID=A0A975CGK9_9BURK|nr:adenylate/guanylate cyclase domain-containing protein [Ottowia testudinis]QTD45174.1 AAA family ATPase [Ottowia testudinis]
MAARFCTQCGAACRNTDRFCAVCGQTLAESPAPWGEVKPATILFADIVDSTRQIAELSPEQAMRQLQPVVERMVAVVEAHGGTVLRTLGDGIMALFGVPRALEQHAEQACLAAVRMQRVAGPQNENGTPRLALRIGIHTGKVASDPTEAGDRRGGGAHGVAIHLASRVAAQAEPGQVLLTDDTRHLLRPGLLAARPVGAWHLKGILHAVALYALRLDVTHASATQAARASGRFLGRVDELAQLNHALGRTRAGQGQVVCISGDPGLGKTRLCAEFAQRCEAAGMPVVRVQAHPLSHALPLRPARELLGALCLNCPPELAPPEARRRIGAALANAGLPSPVDAFLLQELMGVTDDDAPAPAGLPPSRDARQVRLLSLVAELVRADAARVRLLVVDDLHWLDAASGPILSTVAEAISTTRTLLLVNQRGSAPPWPRLPHAAMLALGALAPEALRGIVADRLSAPAETGAPAPALAGDDRASWVERVTERSQGNPFFAEELARHLRRSGADPARWAGELPDSIDGLIAARVDALPAADKRVLQTCAVMGKQVDAAVLARVLRPAPGTLAAALRRLCAAELLARVPGAGGLHFAHPLIQEAAYGAQLRTHKQAVHARVAEVMEQRYAQGPRAGELAALMSHHREQAGHRLAAARHAVRAAQWLRTGDAAQSIAGWRRVLLLLDGEHEIEETSAMSALAAGRIVFLGWRGGITTQEVTQLVARALQQAAQADPRLPQLLHFAHARMRQSSGGSADEYVQTVQRVIAMSAPPGDDGGRSALLHVALCQAYGWAGLLRESLAANDVALSALHRISAFDRDFIGYGVSHWAWSLRARVLLRMGRLVEARACSDRLQSMLLDEPDAVMQGIFQTLTVELDCVQGRWRNAWACAQRVDQAARNRNDYLRVSGAYFFALLDVARHQYTSACNRLHDGLLHLHAKGVAVDFESEIDVLLAEALAARRAWPEAARAALNATALARQRGNRIGECRAALVLVRAALAGIVPPDGDAPAVSSVSNWLARAGELLDATGAELWRPAWRAASARARTQALLFRA